MIQAKDAQGLDIKAGGESFRALLKHKEDAATKVQATVIDKNDGNHFETTFLHLL